MAEKVYTEVGEKIMELYGLATILETMSGSIENKNTAKVLTSTARKVRETTRELSRILQDIEA